MCSKHANGHNKGWQLADYEVFISGKHIMSLTAGWTTCCMPAPLHGMNNELTATICCQVAQVFLVAAGKGHFTAHEPL
jgi:hypothetical protein